MFDMVGLKNGKRYSVRMTEGKLSGDKAMVSIINKEAAIDHGLLGVRPCVKPQGLYLENECSASHLAQLCFDKVLSSSDDWTPSSDTDAVF